MKVIAAIVADFERSALGTPARLNNVIAGETVLRRTLRRVLECKRIASVHLMVDPSQENQAREAAADLDVRVETHSAGRVPWRTYMAAARKFALDGWRGGLVGSTVFDESLHPWVLEALARREEAGGVVDVPPATPLIDPSLIDLTIAHFVENSDDLRLALTQSAPGLSATVYSAQLLGDLAQAMQPIGRTLAYRPSDPHHDIIMQSSYVSPPGCVAHGIGRCIADTETAVDRIQQIIEDAPSETDALHVSERLSARRDERSAFPAEIEIELTIEDPHPNSTVRPRGDAVPQRGPMSGDLFKRLIDQATSRDDVRIVLGGFGDPLLHPQLDDLLQYCRNRRPFALAIRTPAVDLDIDCIERLIETPVDVLNVLLDATTPETYEHLHGQNHYELVIANIQALMETQQRDNRPLPLLVPEMVKTHETMGEMEAFYDHWMNVVGSAVIVGPSHHAGRFPDRAVMNMAPPTRTPCRRILSRMTVLADGSVPVCDQDFAGRHIIGSAASNSLAELWTSPGMESVRQSHRSGEFDGMPLCPACDEWHRP